MKPIRFKESNMTFAENQPEYLPLPAWKGQDGTVISCWKLSWVERIKILINGKVWLRVLTFNQLLQPQLLAIKYPFLRGREK